MTQYGQAVRYARSLGMAVADGLGFTVCGSQLVDGSTASQDIVEMNGWSVEDILARVSPTSSQSRGDAE